MILKASNISHNYNGDIALQNINLEIKKGEFICLIGESGSGKTTLLSILSTLLKPKEGTLFYEEEQYSNIKNINKFRKENIGFVFQFHHLINYLTLLENVQLANDLANTKKIDEIFTLLDIQKIKSKYPTQVSGGQRQRAAIARALINEPKIIFADEPTGNLDSKNAQKVFKLFKNLSKKETTIIVATHNKDLAKMADKIYEVKDGQIK
ncbi:ABC transporter ATP-binding protein [Arcobacter arenosus]|jgi:putative ABC transport system ATP-binding protein|uniref:ABC transporter ATP-binding protein n=1 Tax=Arcobacter arenosus TaxID=2576037 RepID=UPI001E44C061|nr:ABC transporter ATP-binding protein [Arcobacter arenosus]